MKSTTEQTRWTEEAWLPMQVLGIGKQESSAHTFDLQQWCMSVVNALFFKITFAVACCCNSLFRFGCFLSCLWFCSSMFSHRSGIFCLPIFTTYLLCDSLWFQLSFSGLPCTTTHIYILLFNSEARQQIILYLQECKVLRRWYQLLCMIAHELNIKNIFSKV